MKRHGSSASPIQCSQRKGALVRSGHHVWLQPVQEERRRTAGIVGREQQRNASAPASVQHQCTSARDDRRRCRAGACAYRRASHSSRPCRRDREGSSREALCQRNGPRASNKHVPSNYCAGHTRNAGHSPYPDSFSGLHEHLHGNVHAMRRGWCSTAPSLPTSTDQVHGCLQVAAQEQPLLCTFQIQEKAPNRTSAVVVRLPPRRHARAALPDRRRCAFQQPTPSERARNGC